jgi:hypothetical protein
MRDSDGHNLIENAANMAGIGLDRVKATTFVERDIRWWMSTTSCDYRRLTSSGSEKAGRDGEEKG